MQRDAVARKLQAAARIRGVDSLPVIAHTILSYLVNGPAMPHSRTSLFAIGLMTIALIAAHAELRAAEGESADEIIGISHSGLQQIDANRAGELWDAAPAPIKEKVPRAVFAEGVWRARQSVGSVKQRTWSAVIRLHFEAGSLDPPPGRYANVDYTTVLTDGRTVYERISLRLESDGWHVVGYIPRSQ